MSKKKIEVLLIDDHKLLREGLRVLLNTEKDIAVIGEAGTTSGALEFLETTQPDVMIVDLGLPDRNGLELISEVRRRKLDIRMIVLSMHSHQEVVRSALDAGCDGYVPKEAAHTKLIEAIRVVYNGERYLHPVAATALVESLSDQPSELDRFNNLSEREQEVLRLTAMGFSSREAGAQLHLSPKTVETYRQRAFDKLKISHRNDLVRFALAAGIMEPASSALELS